MSITIYQTQEEQQFIEFWSPIKKTVLDSVSDLTAASYGPSIDEFLQYWLDSEERNPIVATTAYRKYLLDKGYKPATVNKKISACRKLFEAAAIVGIGKKDWPFTFEVLQAVKNIHNVPQHGNTFGTRLTEEQLEILCNAPDPNTLLGRRDRMVLALLVGCGLRRSEVCNLTWGHLKREGSIRLIADLVGKHGRIRRIDLPEWVYKTVIEYSQPGKLNERIVISYDRHGNPRGSITTQSIYRIVTEYSAKCGFPVAPHDLRRSHALFLRDKGAQVEDIKANLGHSSIVTTEGYIGKQGDMIAIDKLWEGFGEGE